MFKYPTELYHVAHSKRVNNILLGGIKMYWLHVVLFFYGVITPFKVVCFWNHMNNAHTKNTVS